MSLQHAGLSGQILEAFYDVYGCLKWGFPERFYQRAMGMALTDLGIPWAREVPAKVSYRGREVGVFRLDLVVAETVVVECKVAPRISSAHHAQLLGYLKSTTYELGLVLNFGPEPQVKRLVYRH
jgi:GxxExxY protein